jgi:ATP-dependent protease ClpP protease subunit
MSRAITTAGGWRYAPPGAAGTADGYDYMVRQQARVPSARQWYSIAAHDGGAAEIMIYDEIGYWGVMARDFVRDLAAVTAPRITVSINSPGGDVFDGIAIYNALRQHPAAVDVRIDGLAASAASFIAMAGATVEIQPQAQMMIHEGAGLCIGPAADMSAMAELLNKTSQSIADIYAQRAGGTPDDWRERMRAETWYTAGEAVDAGLCDGIVEAKHEAVAARTHPALTSFRYSDREHAPAPVPVHDAPEQINYAEHFRAARRALEGANT